ncbi:MAG: hypothetical protein WC549_03585 [Actinomycetota bacterium]
MDEEKLYGSKPGDVFCPNCRKPVDKKFVECPVCGMKLKEIRKSEKKNWFSFKKSKKGK